MTLHIVHKKSRLFLLLVVFSSLLLLSGCGGNRDWVMFRGEKGKGISQSVLHPPLGIKWKLKLQEHSERAYAFNNPIVLGDTIYFGSTDGNFYALDIESGYMRWVFKTGGSINSVPTADESKVYVGSNDGKVYALSRDRGELVWSFQTDSTVQSTIIRSEDYVIAISDAGHLFALSPDGREEFSLPNPVWHYFTFQVYKGVIYFVPGPLSDPHSLSVYDIRSRDYLWILPTYIFDAVWYSFAAIHNDSLHFSTSDPHGSYWEFDYHSYDRETGKVIWKYSDLSSWGKNVPSNLYRLYEQNLKLLDYMAPAIWKNLVIYTSGDAVVRTFNANTGRIAWQREFDTYTTSAPTVAGDFVYFGLSGYNDATGEKKPRLVCLSARNGKLMWELETEGALLSAPVVANKWMIFGTDENYFYVLEALF